jgi:cyclic pyranopterin phosphate synthase
MSQLVDACGRRVSYLRLSVTDRCDFRCFYCLPRGSRGFAAPGDWLTPAEIERLVGLFAGLGVSRVRLTGGEPLVRRDSLEIARRVGALAGVTDLSLSTNASHLAGRAEALKRAGVGRINVSLDSLDPARFRRITGGDLRRVLGGLAAARDAGLSPIKINMVVLGGVNADEVGPMVEFCLAQGFTLRFIETMPMGDGGRRAAARHVDLGEVRAGLARRYALEPALMPGGGPAEYVRVAGTELRIGFITPLSQHFCATCNRVRLSVDGTLYLCLGQGERVELRPLLRGGAGDATLERTIREAVGAKPARHRFREQPEGLDRPMSQTGG